MKVRGSRDGRNWPIHSQRFVVSRVGNGLWWSGNGSALVEYAFLLGALTCAIVAGAYLCTDAGIPVFRQVAGTLAADEQPAASSHSQITGNPAIVVTSREGTSEREAQTRRSSSRLAAAFFSAAILAVVLWHIARFRRRTRKESADDEEVPQREEDRLQLKRQILWKNILNDPRLLFKNRVEVRHLMTRDVSVVPGRTPCDDVYELMRQKDIHHVLVCDGDGRLLGVVSDRDVKDMSAKTANEVMTADPIVARPDATAGAAIATMLKHRISCLPVMEGDVLRGILTRTDLLLSLQCMLQWWLRFAQTLSRASDCSDRIDAVQEASGRFLGEQRTRLHSLAQLVGQAERPGECDWKTFEKEASAFLDTAGELMAMQTFEGDRLSEMAGELLEMTKI